MCHEPAELIELIELKRKRERGLRSIVLHHVIENHHIARLQGAATHQMSLVHEDVPLDVLVDDEPQIVSLVQSLAAPFPQPPNRVRQ